MPNATNATNGTEVVDPRDPNHDGMIIGYEEMFDVWGEYQPLHGIKSAARALALAVTIQSRRVRNLQLPFS